MPSWKKIIVSGSDAELNQLTATSFGGNISGSSTSTGSFAVYGNDFLPSEDNTHDLGSSTNEWKDLYLDGVAYIDRADIGNIDIAPHGLNDTIRRPSGNLFLQFGAGASSKLFIGNESGVVIDDTTVSGSSTSTGSFGQLVIPPNGNAVAISALDGNFEVANTVFKHTANGGNTQLGNSTTSFNHSSGRVNTRKDTGYGDFGDEAFLATDHPVAAGFWVDSAGNMQFGHDNGAGVRTTVEMMTLGPQAGHASGSLLVSGSIIAKEGNISGSSTSTGSFGKLLGDGSDLAGIDTDLLGDTTPQLGGNLDLNSNDITGTGNIDITGNITAQNFIVSSSVTSITYQSLSGSTIFGDTSDDIHRFTGSIEQTSTSTASFGRVSTGKVRASQLRLSKNDTEASDTTISIEDFGGGNKLTLSNGATSLVYDGRSGQNTAGLNFNVNFSGMLGNAAATSTNPSIKFTGDTDTGLGRADANQLSLITGGVEAFRVTSTLISGSATSTGSFAKITAADKIEVNGSGTGQVYIGTTAGQIALHAANDSIIQANHYQYTQNANTAIFLGDDNDIATRIHGQNHVRFTFGAAASGYDDRTFFKVASRNSNTYADTLLTGSLHITGSGGDLGSVVVTGNVSGSSTSTGSFGVLELAAEGRGVISFTHGELSNTVIGYAGTGQSLASSGGRQNTLIGYSVGGQITTGDQNVAIGQENLSGGNSTGNTAVGYRALKGVTTGVGNIGIGRTAGDAVQSGDFNIAIGQGSDLGSTTAEHRIVIGHDAAATADNQTVIGGSTQTQVVFGGDALISGSATSTGSFGSLMIGGGHFTSASLASGGSGGGSGISNIVEDSSPQLGGDLDLNSNDITGTGNINIAGNLTVLGTTSTLSTTNIKIGDPFGFFATGSAGTNVDGGIIIQSGSAVDSGSALYHDISTERWSVAKGIASTATTVTDSEWQGYVATVFTSSGSPVDESPKYGVGEIHIDENGDIFIYS